MSNLTRRNFCTALSATVAMATTRGASASTTKKPNIIYVLCDDLGWGDLACYNEFSMVPMPNANRLATQGMRFTDMHSSSAVCTPSRYSILTGRYCWRSKLKKGVLDGESTNLIEPGRLTVPGLLKQQGYYTAGVGKWHLGLAEGEKVDYSKPMHPCPTDHGFDYYFGIPSSLDFAPYLYFENDHVVEQPTATSPGSKEPRGVFWRAGAMSPGFSHEQCLPTITNKAVDVIKERLSSKKQPLFLYVPLPAPHTPWLPMAEYRGKSGAGTYGDYVMEVDAMLGRILAAVKDSGEEDNTLFIFTSDNGADWKPEDIDRYGHRANAEWRGEKADIWEAGHRIPFLARWPGVIKNGTVSDQRLSLTDLMATVAAITGATIPANAAEDSFNILPALAGKAKAPIRPSIIDHSVEGVFCITEGDWKLEEGLGSGGFSSPKLVEPAANGPKGQLYNLARDPHEQHNLYLQQPEIVQHLASLLAQAKAAGHTRPL